MQEPSKVRHKLADELSRFFGIDIGVEDICLINQGARMYGVIRPLWTVDAGGIHIESWSSSRNCAQKGFTVETKKGKESTVYVVSAKDGKRPPTHTDTLTFEQVCGRSPDNKFDTLIFPFTPYAKSRFKDRTGERQGRLLFLEMLGKDKKNGVLWKCLCDCGNLTILRSQEHKTISCGCYQKEVTSTRQKGKRKLATLCPHTERRASARGKCRQCFQIELRAEHGPGHQAKYFQDMKAKLTPEQFSVLMTTRRIRSRFKLTIEEYEKMLLDCEGKCICGNKFSPGRATCAHIDHDHACCPGLQTCGKCIRGLLCSRCNKVLGMLKEDPKLLPQFLLDYLERYKCRRFGLISKPAA